MSVVHQARAFCAGTYEYIAGPLALYSFHMTQHLARTWVRAHSQCFPSHMPNTRAGRGAFEAGRGATPATATNPTIRHWTPCPAGSRKCRCAATSKFAGPATAEQDCRSRCRW
ncbi:hypothetical protein K470DRAFT_19933 [Piedraia hortae CBS 480.64]|uniref:Uncharacterized protein n=1 Tax=Piedraia hortae CBS 480.64 TaxID=1314780 RepID=A0A6A7BNT1_9PEZI|nr:hypothetical protein K470DRAFT_19933 [Piedraia hortae CBS 480.64]